MDEREGIRFGIRGARFWVASVLFLFSGAAGLAYEIIWFKRFSHVWGSSTLAMAAVVTSFLFGLGMGAHRFGRIADRLRSPLFGYGLCEVGIGLLALVVPFEIHWLLVMPAPLHAQLQHHPLAHSLARFGLTFLVIGPACILMGATLPLLIRHFVTSTAAAEKTTAWFYAANTIGAAVGCYVTGFHLLPSIGLFWSNTLAACLNLTIAAVAVGISRGGTATAVAVPTADPEPSAAAPTVLAGRSRLVLLAGAALTGCAALILQMVWARQLALILGGSTYAFSAMLFVILLGIGLGSFAVHALPDTAAASRHGAALVIAFLAGATVAGQRLIPELTYVAGSVAHLRVSQAFNAVFSVTASSALELLPALGMGVLFPFFVRLTGAHRTTTGQAVGDVYAWNTFGTIVGATATPLVLIPHVGSSGAVTAALALYALTLPVLVPLRSWTDRLLGLLVVTLTGAALLLSRTEHDPRVTNSGMYLYGYTPPAVVETQWKARFFREGTSAAVLVSEHDGTRDLRVNGKVDASSGTDMGMQLGLAYFPRFFRPKAKDVLVIGFGSGATSGASLLFPGTRVTCSEIEPAVFAASPYFSDVNHGPEASPSFSIVFDDGRSYLQGTQNTFDLILSEPSNPWVAGVSNLFTREFYETARDRLTDGGILAQWIQTYSSSPGDYALVARTVMGVFPYFGLIRISDLDTILVASTSPLIAGRATLRLSQTAVDAQPEIRADLRRWFTTADVPSLVIRHLLLDEAALKRLVERDPSRTINTDLNMRLEFDAPRHLLLAPTEAGVAKTILAAADPRWLVEGLERWGDSPERIDALRSLANVFSANGLGDSSRQIVEAALTRHPDDPRLLADHLVFATGLEPAVFDAALSRVVQASERQAAEVGVSLWKAKRYLEALKVFDRLAELRPQSATAWNNIAAAYSVLGYPDRARDAFEKSLAIDPFNDATLRLYSQFQKQAAEP